MSSCHRGPENATEVAAFREARRAQLRQEKIAARVALSAADHQRLSAQIEAHLKPVLERLQPSMIGFCWPIRGEFDCRPLVIDFLKRGGRACLPVVVAVDRAMEFRQWHPQSPLQQDRYGIQQPTSGAIVLPDLLLLPFAAFDEHGYRLGYGGGYFDRTLAALAPRPLAIGVGFELARVASILPEAHDIPMDAVVTEAGVQRFSERLML